MVPQKFLPKHFRSPDRIEPELSGCINCKTKGKTGYWAPRPEDVPEPLRDLPHEIVNALSPLSVETGPYPQRGQNGYWVHTDIIRFRWKPRSVLDTIDALPREFRGRARRAWTYLHGNKNSAYKEFLNIHNVVLRKRATAIEAEEIEPSEPMRREPIRFMETVGLECAVWPHLYWDTEMTETKIRSQDFRRLLRAKKKQGKEWQSDSEKEDDESGEGEDKKEGEEEGERKEGEGEEEEEEEEEEKEENGKRTKGEDTYAQSAKASYMAKVTSAVIGYGSNYKLAQFVYDLWMFSSIGGAKNAAGVSMRAAMAGKSFSPEYWRTQHAGLIDLQHQLGYPTLFKTVAPYEWSTPYHVWVVDEMQKQCRATLDLPAAETLHVALLLTEMVRGMLTGANKQQSDRGWKEHVFAAADGSGTRVLNYFGRLEFQDGKRKKAVLSQNYHGRGTVHVHLLVWLHNVKDVDLPSKVFAEFPQEPALLNLVKESQLDWQYSGWPAREGPTEYDEETQALRLRHPDNAHRQHLRAYMPDSFGALMCHEDFQASDGRGALLKYCAGYLPKFSDSFADDLQNDQASDFHLARRVLTEYQPLEPEMFLQLAAQWFRPSFMGGTIRRIVVPLPWDRDLHMSEAFAKSKLIRLYVQSEWRSASMSFLEYLRRSGHKGAVHHRLQKRHKSEGNGQDLHSWIQDCPTHGEVMVAAITYARSNDLYYAQWLVLNVPFRRLQDLWSDKALLVPKTLRYLALCLLKVPQFWRNTALLKEELELEGHRDIYVQNFIYMHLSRKELIDAYLKGERKVQDDPDPVLPGQSTGRLAPGERLTPEQATILNSLNEAVRLALERRYPDEDDADSWKVYVENVQFANIKANAILGPAGSGKTTAVEIAIDRAVESGAKVGIACPTAMLASRYRQRFPNLDVDTVHGMFLLHRREGETLEVMQPYDLMIIDEIGQLTRWHFERIMRLWNNVNRQPALVLVGDFHQLRGMDPTRASDSPWWRSDVHVFRLNEMRRCKCPELKWKLELLRNNMPTTGQLRRMVRHHRAPKLRAYGNFLEPTLEDIAQIMRETPHTTFLTYTRQKTKQLNMMIVTVLYGNSKPLTIARGTPEDNAMNVEYGEYVSFEPERIPIYAGMRLTITRNEDKNIGYVNGMGCVVRAVRKNGIEVKTDQDTVLSIHPRTEEVTLRDGRVARTTFFPIRIGYAVNLHKVQGATLDHVTIWLDKGGVEAAGYVALSRVRHDRDWRFIGYLSTHHFVPARNV